MEIARTPEQIATERGKLKQRNYSPKEIREKRTLKLICGSTVQRGFFQFRTGNITLGLGIVARLRMVMGHTWGRGTRLMQYIFSGVISHLNFFLLPGMKMGFGDWHFDGRAFIRCQPFSRELFPHLGVFPSGGFSYYTNIVLLIPANNKVRISNMNVCLNPFLTGGYLFQIFFFFKNYPPYIM